MAEDPGGSETADVSQALIGGRYRFIRMLGEGAAARTLLCEDVESDRRVALKELHFHRVTDWKYLELFEREAKMLSMLDHPGIPTVYDFFEHKGEETTLYIAQELIEGPSLQERMDSGPMLGQQETYDAAVGLLGVLEYLHGRAPPVLHRDIKPSNVLLCPARGPVLIDFGGVCFGWRPPDVAGTTVVGTFGYMPPEQLVGQGGPASDLYALGATLLHVVTGRPPSEFPFDSGRIEVPTDLPVDERLARLIEALLRPAPRDRPRSAADARRILVGEAPSVAVTVHQTSSPSAGTGAKVPIHSGDGPRFVDMGEPPRDPDGEFKDVYRNLMNPLFPAHGFWGPAASAAWRGVFGIACLVTLGGVYALYRRGVRNRVDKYGDLFRDGRFTSGTIRSVDRRDEAVYATYKYEFEASGALYLAFMDCNKELTRYWGPGDTIPVLYDPEDPRGSCFVYR